ncbi:rotatin [Schistocerca serialis cubense]|uniref:rotatin n=1 Tax=Schistocerca serialis cubense TaxID=2023355 RepID=UPI00214EAE31|nr:rotatin [Schistocerca serialis cubense]
MSDRSVISTLIAKLGHGLEEIRVRALNSLISKLEHGLISDDDLGMRKELFFKLLNWFYLKPCVEKEKVLKLMLQLVKIAWERDSLMLLEAPLSLTRLYEIQTELEAPLKSYVDQIITEITREREDSAKLHGIKETEPENFTQTKEQRHPVGVQSTGFYPLVYPVNVASAESLLDIFPHLLLPWQPLVTTDRHVLKAVEESLTEASELVLLLHSCYFFTDVLLQDFPSEVFLQRPAIVKVFIELMENSQTTANNALYSATVKCLLKVSEDLLVRIRYYCDPCTSNLKQEICTSREVAVSSTSFGSERTLDSGDYLQNNSTATAKRGRQIDRNEEILSIQDQERNNIRPSSNTGATPEGEEDSLLEQLQQLSVPQFCTLVLQVALHLPPAAELCGSAVMLLRECVTPQSWKSQDPAATHLRQDVHHLLHQCAISLHRVSKSLAADSKVIYLQLLSIVRNLLVYLIPVESGDTIPRNLKEQLLLSLSDFSVMNFYPNLHKDIKNYILVISDSDLQAELNLQLQCSAVCKSFAAAVTVLKKSYTFKEEQIITVFRDALKGLEFHKNLSYVDLFMDKCVRKMHRWSVTEKYHNIVVDTTLGLLAHYDVEVQQAIYAGFHQLILDIVGVNYTPNTSSPLLLKVAFHTKFLTEIICFGLAHTDSKVKQSASEMIIHLLKSKLIVSDDCWQMFLSGMLPNLSLLQCFMEKESALGRCIVGIFDPRKSDSIMMPENEVLKANIRALFCVDDFVREDAISSLTYMLSKENQSFEKLPKLSSVNHSVMRNICITEKKVDLFKTRTVEGVYQVGSLCQVMELLTNTNIEARIRRSALTQLSVMLEDSNLQTVFLDQGGLLPLLNIFYNSLIEKYYTYFPDSVVPIISILKNLCLRHTRIRQELSHQSSLHYAILRGLFLFGSDDTFRIDAAILLSLLMYSDHILSTWPCDSPRSDSSFSVPEIVAIRMRLPFICKTHWKESHNRQLSLKGVLMQRGEFRKLLRLTWSSEWFGSIENLLKEKDTLEELQELPFCSELKAKAFDMEEVQMSSFTVCKQYMYDIQNATTHENAETALYGLTRYFNLLLLLPHKESKCRIDQLKGLPWTETFSRFLSATPASPEDEDLLATILRLFNLHAKLLLYSGTDGSAWCIWLSDFFREERQPLIGLLMLDMTSDHDSRGAQVELCNLLLLLYRQCSLLAKHLEPRKWAAVIRTIIRSLHCSDTQHFYNLAFLNSMLNCLTQLTSVRGWSDSVSDHLNSFVRCLVELVKAFHCGKGGDGSASFMGLSISQRSIVCLNHTISELHHFPPKNEDWREMLTSAMGEEDFLWLASLWTSRDPVLRAGAMQLLAGLSLNRQGCIFLLHRLRNFLVWEASLGFLLDHAEANIVREQSAIVLTNLSSHIRGKTSASITALKQDAVSSMLELLKENNFYREAGIVISRLFCGDKIAPGGYVPAPVEAYQQQDVSGSNHLFGHYLMIYGGTPLAEGSSSCSDGNEPHLLTTPGLVKSLCWFILNIVTINPEETLCEINHWGLIRILLRSISDVPACGDYQWNKTLYRDVLEMYTAVCTVLSTCVSLNSSSHDVAVHTHGSINTLIGLLNPSAYYEKEEEFLHLRDDLWSKVFHLLSALATKYEGYKMILQELLDCGENTYICALHKCLKIDSPPDLVSNALGSLTALLSQEMEELTKGTDKVKTTGCVRLQSLLDESSEGGDLCLLLIHVYDTVTLQQTNWNVGHVEICQALGGLLAVSQEATRMALARGLLSSLLSRLRDHHAFLSLEAVDNLLNKSNKKKLAPVLRDVELLLELLTNFLFGSINVKSEASEAGMADLIHKMWVWFSFQSACLLKALRLMCTFTTDCVSACRSLILTSTVHGVGLRKSPSSMSLLHTVVNLVLQEMSLTPQSSNLLLLKFALHLLKNACQSQECRTAMIKSNLLRGLTYLHTHSRKPSTEIDYLQNMWLDFLTDFSSYPEGQITISKASDSLDTLMVFAKTLKEPCQIKALEVLRNVTFSHSNRARLVGHGEYIKLLFNKLSEGSLEQKYLVVLMVWAVTANNQKAKITMKSAGIATKLQDIVNQLNLSCHSEEDEKKADIFSYVLSVLNADDKKNLMTEDL